MIESDDGFRFLFKHNGDTVIMIDTLKELPDLTMNKDMAIVLGGILADQHALKREKEENFRLLNGALNTIEKAQERIDKDILIALINNFDFTFKE